MSYLLASSGMFYVWDVYHESGIIISTDLKQNKIVIIN